MRPNHARPGRSRTRTLVLVAGLSAALVPQTAHASTGTGGAPTAVDGPDGGTPQPYGGQLGRDATPAGPDDVGGLGLLAFGAINAVGMVAGGAVDALRGPSPEQTRRAMASRTFPGTVSERPRGRRAGAVAVAPVAPRPSGAHRRGRHLRAVGPA